MIPEYSRCSHRRRCVIKTDDSYFYRKFTPLCRVNNSKCVGWKLYEQGGMTKDRLVEFLKENVFGKYKDNLIVLDNAGSHRNEYVKQAIIESGNKYLFSFFIIIFPFYYKIITLICYNFFPSFSLFV